ncbi:RNA-binding domain-containing protein [Ignicoccus hospitalis]|uniref:UPF0201 protein Igni_0958 n=1 Tax=Ignicoccus hospitalis (strain KIN4/I / DSM 18386 / JCM 14125) TaxID=453591 RepID=A8AB36_IGNH4|nr:RNA-binding domain-containing protein [Ignicoccus hospitalis]ABU82138.1 Protein of unknown function DUF54 [Ignicoccus hospitalis KIN4/I]HIH91095.1 hypothetical protein [Desulfurococcaceae archaeon]
MRVRVEAEVRPTEDPNKVLKALRNLFNMEFKLVERGRGWASWVGESEDLTSLLPLKRAIQAKAVDETFYKYLKRLSKGTQNLLIFKLNKQAAYAGTPSLAEEDVESPLGAITVEVEAEDVKKVIAWLTGKEGEVSGRDEDSSVRQNG